MRNKGSFWKSLIIDVWSKWINHETESRLFCQSCQCAVCFLLQRNQSIISLNSSVIYVEYSTDNNCPNAYTNMYVTIKRYISCGVQGIFILVKLHGKKKKLQFTIHWYTQTSVISQNVIIVSNNYNNKQDEDNSSNKLLSHKDDNSSQKFKLKFTVYLFIFSIKGELSFLSFFLSLLTQTGSTCLVSINGSNRSAQ